MIETSIYNTCLYSDTQKVNAFEVAAVKVDEDGNCERLEETEEEQANFFSVYIHFSNGGSDCIADCKDREDAEKLAKLLQLLVNNYENTQE